MSRSSPSDCSAFELAPGDVEGALKKVLEYIRIRQREIRDQQDRCHKIGAEESKKALMDRHDEIDCVAEVVNQLRWIANGRPNYQEVAGEALPPSIGSTQRITP